ncbi:hypothetical protein G7K_3326-t1 [Saitoella complicata NRRL Y-17804]|uniref:Uncharacterized protein n=1 Tax=Saitoella complicata (strain BCRC 22490 / CBS 7301 / JCM 7358 / NBRC 10748 / NRRL Y-17804) TaxID=698492 RepID=A0A0E9NH82_SAICN|nr:hypothetical protein G7K_3326-t1 [Saitoella complicata NRRL Y-17804]
MDAVFDVHRKRLRNVVIEVCDSERFCYVLDRIRRPYCKSRHASAIVYDRVVCLYSSTLQGPRNYLQTQSQHFLYRLTRDLDNQRLQHPALPSRLQSPEHVNVNVTATVKSKTPNKSEQWYRYQTNPRLLLLDGPLFSQLVSASSTSLKKKLQPVESESSTGGIA